MGKNLQCLTKKYLLEVDKIGDKRYNEIVKIKL